MGVPSLLLGRTNVTGWLPCPPHSVRYRSGQRFGSHWVCLRKWSAPGVPRTLCWVGELLRPLGMIAPFGVPHLWWVCPLDLGGGDCCHRGFPGTTRLAVGGILTTFVLHGSNSSTRPEQFRGGCLHFWVGRERDGPELNFWAVPRKAVGQSDNRGGRG